MVKCTPHRSFFPPLRMNTHVNKDIRFQKNTISKRMSPHRNNFGKLFIVVRITTQKLYWYIIQACVENKRKILKNDPQQSFSPFSMVEYLQQQNNQIEEWWIFVSLFKMLFNSYALNSILWFTLFEKNELWKIVFHMWCKQFAF